MPLTQPQKLIADDQNRWRVVAAGRRFGKTHLCLRELARFAAQPDRTIWYIAPSYRMAKQIIWTPIKQKLMDLNWVLKKDESDLRLDLVNGSRIALRGADNPDSLRGNRVDFVVFDEVADIHSSAFYEVIRPALADSRGHALFVGTPKGRNWFYDLFNSAKSLPDWSAYQYTTAQGGQVSEDELESAREQLDSRTYKQEFEATFVEYSGVVAYNFTRELVKTQPYDVSSIIVSMDFNVNPITAVVYVRNRTGLHAIDEIVIHGSNTDEMVEEIRTRYSQSRVTVYPDPAGVQRKTSAGGRTDISILQNAGFSVLFKRQHPRIRDRVNAINALMKNVSGEYRYTIDPKCKNLIESYEKLTYKEGTQVIDKDSGYDHLFDAATYAVDYLFPVTDQRPKPEKPKNWQMQVA